MNESPLRSVLTRIAEQARPARIAPDTRRRGVRRRRLRQAGAVLAVLTVGVTASLLPAPGGGSGFAPADGPRARVPARVYSPVTGEGIVTEAPPGPAAIVVSGDSELRGSDVWGYEGRSLVVGQNGRYRLARTYGETSAGLGSLLLSPDGRFLADRPDWLEGGEQPDEGREQAVVVDLTTGKLVQYDGGSPVAWSPDGGSILLHSYPEEGDRTVNGTLRLLDLQTGRATALPHVPGLRREGDFATFSPDGTRIVVSTGTALHVIDIAGNSRRKLADLGGGDRLAGPGAWLPDGDRIAVYSVDRCQDLLACDEADLRARQFDVRYLDADDGRPVDGPRLAPARGLTARILGWQRDDAAVVAVYALEEGWTREKNSPPWSEFDWWLVGGVELLAFRPDGSRDRLVELPESALFVEVPANLLDSFGGPSPSPVEGAVRWFLALYWPLGQFVVLLTLLLVVVIGAVVWRRRRRRRRLRTSPPLPQV